VLSSPDRDWSISYIINASNINRNGPAEVGSFTGMTSYGTMDMIGNAREWCFNRVIPGNHNYIVGGGWSDPTYFANSNYTQDPWDRTITNGFRCAKYLHSDKMLSILMEPVKSSSSKNFEKEKPITDKEFEIFRRMYTYDKSPLDARIESEDNESNWIRQKITYRSAYDINDRIISYLFVPKSSKPPYNIVIYFPGSAATKMLSSEILSTSNFDFIIKGGRAVLYPVYKGTYERRYDPAEPVGKTSNRGHTIQWYQDLARSIDYLETRKDIYTDTIAYLGFSWGGRMGPIFSALDNRLSVLILYIAGLHSDEPYPEADPFSFIPRVKVPVLILNGRYDATFPYETSQKPLFDFLGTNISDKRMFVYPSGHSVPRNELIRETLSWLDKYMGTVDMNSSKKGDNN
jgi:dienelactone hydrolase